jgi:hypothetical protein
MTLNNALEGHYNTLTQTLVDRNVANPGEMAAIKRAITGYSYDPDVCCLSVMFYHIWNAVKAIFCQSDWQLAESALKSVAGKAAASAVQNSGVIGQFALGLLQSVVSDRDRAAAIKTLSDQLATQFLETMVQVNSTLNEGGRLVADHQRMMDDMDRDDVNLFRLVGLQANTMGAAFRLESALDAVFG